MRILVTGGAGYIGCVLTPMLQARGHQVRVVDSGMFGVDHLPPGVETIVRDLLEFDLAWLEGVDAVIHLAGLSNEPMAEVSPSMNYLVNAAGTAIVAEAAKRAGVQRFIFGSTCSVYGLADETVVDEDTHCLPCFPYAISKLMAERALTCLTDESFRPIILRKGTVVGWSPRMRFDLVVNTMVKTALTQGKIFVHNPGLWRPLVDVRDAAMAYVCALDADPNLIGTFNIAYENYTIGRLAEEVTDVLKEFDVSVSVDVQHRQDVRSYRVTTSRATKVLDFQPLTSMRMSARRIVEHIRSNQLDLEDPRYVNVEWMKLTMAERIPEMA